MDDRPDEHPDDERPANGPEPVSVENEIAGDGVADADVAGEAAAGPVRDTDAEDEAAHHPAERLVSGTTPSLSHVRAPTIVIRRKRRGDHGAAHGGSWKIAY